jgi:hypothetical protein
MKTTVSLLVLAAAGATALTAQTASSDRARRIADDIRYLASDALQGRKVCGSGNDSAAAYIARELARLSLMPRGDGASYFQRWAVGNTTATRQAGVANCATRNVVAALPGRGALAGQVVILGAHFDHLGTGPFGSASRDSGVIHNGADDNASGTAALLEVARLLAEVRDRGPRRTVVLGWWNGEEEGALGSAYFAEHMSTPRESVTAYLNFDMVGRLRDGRLLALGARTAVEWPALLDSANATLRLDLRASGDGWGPSDHASFTAKGIPVLHFFTDLHEDYHRPGDDAERINADGIAQVADLGADLAQRLARRPDRLTYVDVPRPAPVAAASGRPRPSLGTIPDMSDEPGGVRLSGVRSGSPADSAGLRAGDILIGLGAHPIANLEDFQNALMAHAAGDRVEVRFRRGTETRSVMVTLGGRPAN